MSFDVRKADDRRSRVRTATATVDERRTIDRHASTTERLRPHARACVAASSAAARPRSHGAKNGEWRAWAGDLGATRYAPLDQINAANFNTLEVAWRFKTDNLGPRPDFNLQTTPLMVNGVLYFTAGSRRNAVAVDAATGEMLWMHRLEEGARADDVVAPAVGPRRRLLDRRQGRRADLLRLDRLSAGRPRREDRAAAEGLRHQRRRRSEEGQRPAARPRRRATSRWNGAPVVARNVVIVGAAHRAGTAPRSKANAKGYIRGYDARTGKRLWIFHTIPRPGEFGNDTWLNDSWSYTGHTGVWTQLTVDEELGIAYLPVEIPTGDYFGGHRPGNNLFAESLVALNLETGKRLWHFQFVHHPIWDYDVPCAPILADITVERQADQGGRAADQAGLRSTCSIA